MLNKNDTTEILNLEDVMITDVKNIADPLY